MGTIVILGSANAVADENHGNAHFVIQLTERAILVDCTGNPTAELQRAGVNPDSLTDVILTHFHPDHVSSTPLLLMDLWLLGRKKAITIHGLADTLDRMETMMNLYDWQNWPGFFQINYHRISEEKQTVMLEDDDLTITASPVKHLIPTIGIRVDLRRSGKAIAYSSDTEPDQNVVDLASGVDVLIHEATGSTIGHSLPIQAGEVAQRAAAKSLYMIHYPPSVPEADWINAASKAFSGPVFLSTDFQRIEID
jgi:ribonuclease Z